MLSSSEDGTLRLWNAKTGEEIRRFVGHTNCVFDTDISPDRRRVVSASFDNTIRLWDLASGKELHRFTTSARVWSVRFTPDGRGAVSAGDDRVIRLWRLPD